MSGARIAAASLPLDPGISESLERLMRGKPPLVLFTTLARDPRLLQRLLAGGLLDRGNLSLRQREIVIDRTTALCHSEYEWGVHIATFAEHAQFTSSHIASFVIGTPEDECWAESERLLLRLCDSLHACCDIDDTLWAALKTKFTDEALLEALMLAGSYRMVSYLTNALRLPLESAAARFPRK